MCLPWNHKWETAQKDVIKTWEDGMDREHYLPEQKIVIQQRCTHCGKVRVRKYRV